LYQYLLDLHSFPTRRSSDLKNGRFIPGAILAAIIAASIGNVPLPQNGSTNGCSGFQRVNKINAAANVSLIGAFAVLVRYPLLCKDRKSTRLNSSHVSISYAV